MTFRFFLGLAIGIILIRSVASVRSAVAACDGLAALTMGMRGGGK